MTIGLGPTVLAFAGSAADGRYELGLEAASLSEIAARVARRVTLIPARHHPERRVVIRVSLR
jgi:hypothetical protein